MGQSRMQISNSIGTDFGANQQPYAYLRYLFTELPKAETVEAIEALLPGNLSKDQIRIG